VIRRGWAKLRKRGAQETFDRTEAHRRLVRTREQLAKKREQVDRKEEEANRWKEEAKRLRHSVLQAGSPTGPSLRPPSTPEEGSLYLDLMKRTLSGWVYADGNILDEDRSGFDLRGESGDWKSFDPAIRENGADWPENAHTMIGLKRLENIQSCTEDVLVNAVPGDLIETGVWRGGATILMRAILRAHGVEDRSVWVADSFAGLPPPDAANYPRDRGKKLHTFEELAVPLEEVKANFERYGLLDDQVRFLKGWFKDTLPQAPIERLAVLRLDGDMYESTMDALVHLYPKLSVGGYLIVDDYGAIRVCREAVHDYREEHGIREEIQSIDWSGIFWQRTE
jgi:hypothetical protein